MNTITRHAYRAPPAVASPAFSSIRLTTLRAEYDRLAALVQANQATRVQRRRAEVLRVELGITGAVL